MTAAQISIEEQQGKYLPLIRAELSPQTYADVETPCVVLKALPGSGRTVARLKLPRCIFVFLVMVFRLAPVISSDYL